MKCIGCGVNLQTTDPDKKGYVGEIHIIENGEQVYCKRCFDIIHYNRRYVPQIDNKAFEDKMNKIRTNNKYDVVLLLVDVLDIYSGLSKEIAKLIGNLKVIILINKIDLMPKSVKLRHIEESVKSLASEYGLNVIGTYLVSARSKKNIENVLKKIDKIRINKYTKRPYFNNCYVVGNASVGKSTFINSVKEICYGSLNDALTTSDQFQTTMDMIKVELGSKFYMYDTPGIINDKSFNAYLDYESVKMLTPKSFLKVRTFQLNKEQTIFLGGLVKLDIIEGSNISTSFFVSNELYLHRTKLQNSDKIKETQEYKLLVPPLRVEEKERLGEEQTIKLEIPNDDFYDLIISGVGFIHLKGEDLKVNLTMSSKIGYTLLKSIL